MTTLFPHSTTEELVARRADILKQGEEMAHKNLIENKNQIEKILPFLMEKGTLSRLDLKSLLKHGSLNTSCEEILDKIHGLH